MIITIWYLFLLIFALPIWASRNDDTQDILRARMRKTSYKPKKKPRKSIKDMDFDELNTLKNERLTQGYNNIAIELLERMIKLCDDIPIIADLIIELADLLYDTGNFDKAAHLYEEFTHLYPGHHCVEYALYQAIVCSWKCTYTYDRDQTKTEETLALTRAFLMRIVFVTYTKQVQDIQMKCYQKLAAHDMYVCSFYVKRGNMVAAQKRLDHIITTWQPILNCTPTFDQIEDQMVALVYDQVSHRSSNQQRRRMSRRF